MFAAELYLIFAKNHHLMKVDKEGMITKRVVCSEEDGYASGVDTSARFKNITGFLQQNRTHCILVNSNRLFAFLK